MATPQDEALVERAKAIERRKAEIKADPSKAQTINDLLLTGDYEYLGGGLVRRKDGK